MADFVFILALSAAWLLGFLILDVHVTKRSHAKSISQMRSIGIGIGIGTFYQVDAGIGIARRTPQDLPSSLGLAMRVEIF